MVVAVDMHVRDIWSKSLGRSRCDEGCQSLDSVRKVKLENKKIV